MTASINDDIILLMGAIESNGNEIKDLHSHPAMRNSEDQINASEIHANITLAYRHLEDARSRLAKALQSPWRPSGSAERGWGHSRSV